VKRKYKYTFARLVVLETEIEVDTSELEDPEDEELAMDKALSEAEWKEKTEKIGLVIRPSETPTLVAVAGTTIKRVEDYEHIWEMEEVKS
jgi:hypothetical protein